MKRVRILVALAFLLCLLPGCAALYGAMYNDATTMPAYPGPEVIRDHTKVATPAFPSDYGLAIDGVQIKAMHGETNPMLRIAKNLAQNSSIYTVDILP